MTNKRYPNRAYIVINYPKIAYFAIMWLLIIPTLPFAILAAISDPIVNWYCKFGDKLRDKLNL